MSDIHRVGDVEIDEDLQFQRRDWVVQRVGWVLTILLVLATLAGLFGRGPLASTSIGEGDAPLRVEYQRFLRRESNEQLAIRVAPGAARNEARILLDSAFLGGVRIQNMIPRPASEIATADGVVYAFPVESASAPILIRIDFRATGYWSERGVISLAGHAPLRLAYFVYP